MSIVNLIKSQIGSDGEKGWPVSVSDRIAYPGKKKVVSEANVGLTFLWTMRDAVIPKLEKENLAIATNFYTPAGLEGMVRNILGNPYIRYLIILGNEYSSKEGKGELTSANAIRAFFEKGIDENRRIPGFENSVHFDSNIPTEMIEKVRENVQLIDLNKEEGTLEEKIAKANELLRTLKKKEPFMKEPMVFDYEKSDEPFPFGGGPFMVNGSTIPKVWIEIMHAINKYGRKNLMNANTDRWIKEINNLIAVIHDPQNLDLSINPFLVPMTQDRIDAYVKEILSPELPEGKAYTYGNKLRAYLHSNPRELKEMIESDEYKDWEFGKGPHIDANVKYSKEFCEINQISDMIDVLKRDLYSKACVAITWHVNEELMRKHKSSPCLVLLQAIVQDESLNLTVFFRSHDMVQGWPENAYGCAAIQKEIADGVGIKPGILTIISGSAQIYKHYYKQVDEMLKKFRKREEKFDDPKGNYLIKIKDGEIVVTLVDSHTGKELETFKGKTAKELYTQISFNEKIDSDHAMYVGYELAKAEMALSKGTEYEQDRS